MLTQFQFQLLRLCKAGFMVSLQLYYEIYPIYFIHLIIMMYQLHLNFKNKTKKLTISKNLTSLDLANLISNTFGIKQKIVGLTNQRGKFIDLKNLYRTIATNSPKEIYYLITAQDINQQNMSFASQYRDQMANVFDFDKKQSAKCILQSIKIPNQSQNNYLGLIGDLQVFEDLILQQNKVGLIICFIKYKPKGVEFPYYLYHTNKNSALIYFKKAKICQFFIENMKDIPREIFNFIQSLQQKQQTVIKEQIIPNSRINKQQLILQNHFDNIVQNENNNVLNDNQLQSQSKNSSNKEADIKQSLLQNLVKLKEEQQISEFQFYKMKSELLQNIQEFIRKYQMGTRKGLRKEPIMALRKAQSQKSFQKQTSNGVKYRKQYQKEKQIQKSKVRMYSRDERRFKKYEIPIIVRKYNNVIQKISTSYPLTQDQEQSINLILQLQLKGLISQKESGIYKASILQEDPQVFALFVQYFNGILDQVQLVGNLKRIKKIGSQKKQRAEHNMRLLMKYSRQLNYQLLRTLLLQGNMHIINSLQKFRNQKNSQLLVERLQKIANFYRQKESLEDMFQNL